MCRQSEEDIRLAQPPVRWPMVILLRTPHRGSERGTCRRYRVALSHRLRQRPEREAAQARPFRLTHHRFSCASRRSVRNASPHHGQVNSGLAIAGKKKSGREMPRKRGSVIMGDSLGLGLGLGLVSGVTKQAGGSVVVTEQAGAPARATPTKRGSVVATTQAVTPIRGTRRRGSVLAPPALISTSSRTSPTSDVCDIVPSLIASDDTLPPKALWTTLLGAERTREIDDGSASDDSDVGDDLVSGSKTAWTRQYCQLQGAGDIEADVRTAYLLQQHDDWFKGGAASIGAPEVQWERDEIYDQLMRERIQVLEKVRLSVQVAPGQEASGIEGIVNGTEVGTFDEMKASIFLATSVDGMQLERSMFWDDIMPVLQAKYSAQGFAVILVDVQQDCSPAECNSPDFISYFLDELTRCDIVVGFCTERYGEAVKLPNQITLDDVTGRVTGKPRSLMDHMVTELRLRNPNAKALYYLREQDAFGTTEQEAAHTPEEQELVRDMKVPYEIVPTRSLLFVGKAGET